MSRETSTAELKLQAIPMTAARGLALAEVARRLGVSEGCLRAWRDAARDEGDAAFPGRGRPPPADEELLPCGPRTGGSGPSGTCSKKAAADFASPPT